MADRIIKIILAGSSESAVRAFEETAGASEAAQGKVEGMGKLGGMLKNPWVDAGLVVGTVAIGIGAAATAMASEYQESTSKMAAQAGITNQAAKGIGDAFLSTAFSSTFSAKQMMDAYGPVAGQLGQVQGHALTSAQALGVMSAASDLAEASGTDLTTATGVLASQMQAFGIKADGAAQASDTLFNVSRTLAMPMSDLGGELAKLHSKLGPAGGDMQDLSSSMVDLAEHGLTGRTAISALSSAATALQQPSKQATQTLTDMGLKSQMASLATGDFGTAVGILGPKLANMSDAQRRAAEDAIFGKGAYDKLDATLRAGGQGMAAATAQATKLGSAHEGAETATDNLQGALAKAKAGVSDLGVQLGQILLPVVTNIVKWFDQSVVPALHTVFTAIQQNMPTINRVFQTLGQILGTVVKVAFTAVTIVVQAWVVAIKIAIPIVQTIATVFTAVAGVVSAVVGTIVNVIGTIVGAVQAVVSFVAPAFSVAFKVISTVIGTEIGIVINVIKSIVGVVGGVVSGITGLFQGVATGIGNIWQGVVDTIKGVFNGLGNILKGIIDVPIGLINGIIDFINQHIQIHIPAVGVGPIHTPSFDWNGLNLGHIPTLDSGGIAYGPTLAALSMNSVPEVVAPLPDLKKMLNVNGRAVQITQEFNIYSNDTELKAEVQALIEKNNDELAKAVTQKAA